MKIQKVTIDHRPEVYALLKNAFPGSDYEASLAQKLAAPSAAALKKTSQTVRLI